MMPFRKFSGALKDTGLVVQEECSIEADSQEPKQTSGKILGYLKTKAAAVAKD
jgi:hypothetical protein